MTLSPSESLNVKAVLDRPKYKLNTVCAHPFCHEMAREGHHLWRRSMTGVPADWVDVDGHVIGNLVGLCRLHHQDVNGGIGGHRAWITLEDGELVWNDRAYHVDPTMQPGWIKLAPLSWQPPGETEMVTRHEELPEGETCPTCGHKKPRKPREPGKPKTRMTIIYPKDEAVVLPEMLEQTRLALGRPPDTSPYYVILDALVFVLLHEHLLEKK